MFGVHAVLYLSPICNALHLRTFDSSMHSAASSMGGRIERRARRSTSCVNSYLKGCPRRESNISYLPLNRRIRSAGPVPTKPVRVAVVKTERSTRRIHLPQESPRKRLSNIYTAQICSRSSSGWLSYFSLPLSGREHLVKAPVRSHRAVLFCHRNLGRNALFMFSSRVANGSQSCRDAV